MIQVGSRSCRSCRQGDPVALLEVIADLFALAMTKEALQSDVDFEVVAVDSTRGHQ